MMFCVVVTGVDSRVIVQTSMSVLSDRQQSMKRMKRLRLNYSRPTSLDDNDSDDDDNNDDNIVDKRDTDAMLSWLSVLEERQLTSTPFSSSLAPSAGGVDVVPDISRLDFIRRIPALGRPLHGGSGTRQSSGSESRNLPVRRLTDGDGGRSRLTGLLPRTVVGGGRERSASGGRDWRTAVLATSVTCFAVGLLLSVIAVWIRQRRRALRTPKL